MSIHNNYLLGRLNYISIVIRFCAPFSTSPLATSVQRLYIGCKANSADPDQTAPLGAV